MAKSAESIPLPRPVEATLRGDATLAGLTARLRRSQACLEVVLPVVPPALRPHLLAGPWDDQGWTLLTRQAAALTKLRQLVPVMERALANAGMKPAAIRLHALMR